MTRRGDLAQPDVRMFAQLGRIAEELKALARVQEALRELYRSVLGRDIGLQAVLRQVAVTAMDLTGARYGALGVLSEDGDYLAEFVPAGLTGDEEAAAAPLGSPHGRGLLGHLMTDPRPLRVDSISEHPMAAGLPPGHPRVHTLLGVAFSSRGQTYGNLYVSDRRDGQPFDEHDEAMIVALADAAGLAIDDARLLGQLRNEAEEFQRLLQPRLPDLRPIEAAALCRPCPVIGDWYDAIRLCDDTRAVVIGDIGGHGVRAAAVMAQTRSMLRALLHERRNSPAPCSPSSIARSRPWLTPRSPPPVLPACARPASGGACTGAPRATWPRCSSCPGSRDGTSMPSRGYPSASTPALPALTCSISSPAAPPSSSSPMASSNTTSTPSTRAWPPWPGSPHSTPGQPPERLCQALLDNQPGDGPDDIAILALRLPPDRTS